MQKTEVVQIQSYDSLYNNKLVVVVMYIPCIRISGEIASPWTYIRTTTTIITTILTRTTTTTPGNERCTMKCVFQV